MTDESVCTDDPHIESIGTETGGGVESVGEVDGSCTVSTLTFRTEDGRRVPLERGEPLIDENGIPVGVIDRIHHAPENGSSSWIWTVYIDYTSEDLNDAEPGGVPLGEIASQMERGILLTAR